MNVSNADNKTYSRTAEYRKICKPIVERKRRARMNKSLIELKSIILDVVKKDGCQYSKLEKADILEMTVKHLHELRRCRQQQQQCGQSASDPEETVSIDKFRTGFVQCAAEVSRFVCQISGKNNDDRGEQGASPSAIRLLHHLNSCVGQIDYLSNNKQTTYSKGPTTPEKLWNPKQEHHYTPPTSPVCLSPGIHYNISPTTTAERSMPMESPLELTTSNGRQMNVHLESKSDPICWRPW